MKRLLMAGCALGMALALRAERVIFVGDSITGLGENHGQGFAKQMRTAMADAGKADAHTFVCLGGSGQTVGSWLGLVHHGGTLDVPNVKVGEEFDKGADTLIVGLGMNDALASTVDIPTIAAFEENYQKLIDRLKERVKFKRLFIAQPTMYSENPETYKNRLMAEMCKAVDRVAKANDLPVIRVFDQFVACWETARMDSDPEKTLTLTYDYVHPNERGHLAMAVAFLKALGEEKAADAYYKKMAPEYLGTAAAGKPGFLWYVVQGQTPNELAVKGKANQKIALVKVDGDFKGTAKFKDNTFIIQTKQPFTRLTTTWNVTVTFTDRKVCKKQVTVHAPWLVCPDAKGAEAWDPGKNAFDEEKLALPQDKLLAEGKPFEAVFPNAFVYFPNQDVTGRQDHPNSVDFNELANGNLNETGYALRYVHSPKAGNVKMVIRHEGFGGPMFDTVFINGKQVYAKPKDKPEPTSVALNQGWNAVLLRVHHKDWQFQCSLGFEKDDLDPSLFQYALKPASTPMGLRK